MDKIFANNHVACHTLPDLYLSSEVANKMSLKMINKILQAPGKRENEDYEKLKSALFSANRDGMKEVQWFLK